MEKSVWKGAGSPEVKKVALNSVYLSLQYLLPRFSNTSLKPPEPTLWGMNQRFGRYCSVVVAGPCRENAVGLWRTHASLGRDKASGEVW